MGKLYKKIFMSIGLTVVIGCSRPVPTAQDPSSIDVSRDPVQIRVKHMPSIKIKTDDAEYTLTPMAKYEISALVASRKNYSGMWTAELAPVDLALVWGKLADPEYDKFITYSQSNRWYYYRYKAGSPFDNNYVIRHSSNHHIIPASENILKAVKTLRSEDHIYLEGYLVNVRGTYRGHKVWWNTSLSRSDTGNGACEVFYVKKVKIDGNVYE